jgi:hypothetical protein
MTRALRLVAIVIAVAAFIDPAFAVHRPLRPHVDIRSGRGAEGDPRAAAVRDRLIREHGRRSRAQVTSRPSAVVLIGARPDEIADVPAGVPLSIVEVTPPPGEARIVKVSPPGSVLPGQTAIITAEVVASGLAGQTSTVRLEEEGVQVARATVKWSQDQGRAKASLAYVPPAAGLHRLRVAVGEEGSAGAHVDVALTAEDRPLRVIVYEPRPSWMAAFVRRALEGDPAFDTATFVQPSRGVEISAGTPPRRLTAAALTPYDAAIVGAPEALSAAEVQALDMFARTRGGAVILLPDRRPSGPITRLLAVDRFDALLIETPVRLDADAGIGPSAAEFALPSRLPAGASTLASARLQGRERPVIISSPAGAGRIVFSGALDAWRYRADDDSAFARFWTGTVASLAAAAPRSIGITLSQALASPGDRIIMRAAIRRTEWQARSGRTVMPSVGATLIASNATQQPVRLWPAAEAGTFEGQITAPAPGRYTVHISAAGHAADTPLLVADDVRTALPEQDDRLRAIARASGGVVASVSDPAPLDRHLQGLASVDVASPLRPMRSSLWIVLLAGALGTEWAVRRSRGLR